MRFWDSSALVPLLVSQPSTGALYEIVTGDTAMSVWWGSEVECVAAVARLRRTGLLPELEQRAALARLRALSPVWREVQPSHTVRENACRLLIRHALTAADALQLAAALAAADGDPESLPLVCLDDRLRTAAASEGFHLLP
jgi:hypothetical protein